VGDLRPETSNSDLVRVSGTSSFLCIQYTPIIPSRLGRSSLLPFLSCHPFPTEYLSFLIFLFVPPRSRPPSLLLLDTLRVHNTHSFAQVFRNPVLGLHHDLTPRFIRPFASSNSAKIMLDPGTGVSRGYGFVRFTDEADQQRALIEMNGLYCLSRPSECLFFARRLAPVVRSR
jgi:RNA recognition motif-containing protein